MAMAEDGSFKPVIRQPRVALTSKAAMAGYIYACEFCDTRFQSMKYLKDHQPKCKAKLVKEDGGSDVFTCSFCYREFTCGAFAKSHMRYCNHSARMKVKSTCPYCKNEVKTEDLDKHRKTCLARKENIIYTCSFCGFRSENQVDAKSHSERCRAQRALEYAPRQVLHKCKSCGKLFQGKDNFIRHAGICSLSKVDNATKLKLVGLGPTVPIPGGVVSPAPTANTPPPQRVDADKNTSPDVNKNASPARKRPHSIKQNPDGSMVIVLGERAGARNKSSVPGGDELKRARFASPEELGRSSIVIDLRGKQLITEGSSEKNRSNEQAQKESRNMQIKTEGKNEQNESDGLQTERLNSPPVEQTATPTSSESTEKSGPESTQKRFVCGYCKVPYESKHVLKRHIKSCYLGEQRYSLKCSFCTSTFSTLWSRTNHEKVCESRNNIRSPVESADVWNVPLTVPEQPAPAKTSKSPAVFDKVQFSSVKNVEREVHLCDYCKVPYENHHLLNRHMKSCYLGKQRYSLKCSFCSLVFADLRSRMNHEKNCHSRPKNKKPVCMDAMVYAGVHLESPDEVALPTREPPSTSASEAPDTMSHGLSGGPVIDPEIQDAYPMKSDAGRTLVAEAKEADEPSQTQTSSAPEREPSQEEEEEEEEEETEVEPSPAKSPVRAAPPRFSSQKYTCEICGMGGFQQESSLYMHKTFCEWVSEQKVKVKPEKKRSTGLSIAASTSDNLFNETIDDADQYKTSSESVVHSEQGEGLSGSSHSADVSEVSCKGHDDSHDHDSSLNDSLSDGEGESQVRRPLYVDGTVDSDDETKKVRHRRSGQKVDRMSVSPRSVGSHGSSRGSSVDRSKTKSGQAGKVLNNSVSGKTGTKKEIECQCGDKFGSKEAHKTHLRNCSKTALAKGKRIKCKKCKKRVREMSFAGHLKMCQRTCLHCERMFGNITAAIAHQKYCIGKDKVKKSSKESGAGKAKMQVESDVSKSKKTSEQKGGKTSVTKEQQKGGKSSVTKQQNVQAEAYKCHKCAGVFLNAGALGKHKLTCGNDKAKKTCVYCKKVFQWRKSCLRHQLKCSAKPATNKGSAKTAQGKKSFFCGKCKRYFGNAGALAFHKYSCRGKVEASKTAFQGSAGSVVCPKCKKRFGNLGALGAHKKFCIVPKKGHKKLAKPAPDGKSGGNFKCEYCKKMYASLQALAGHIGFCKYSNVAKPKEMPYSCQKCKRGFLSTQSLAVHVKHKMCFKPDKPKNVAAKGQSKERNKDNKCSKCHRTFGSPGALGFHFKTCQGKKPNSKTVKFKCKNCSTVSKDAKTYAAHVKVCRAKKSSSALVTCRNCNSKFPNMQSLGGHIRFCNQKGKDGSKSETTPHFSCNFCGMKTKSAGGLTYHMVYFCKKRKGKKIKLKNKQGSVKPSPKKVVEQSPSKGEVSCPFCGKIFGNGGALGSHARFCKERPTNALGEKMTVVKNATQEFKNDVHVVYVFVCPQCGVKFDNKAQLLQHFLACMNTNPDENGDENVEDAKDEPQPGTSGVAMPEKPVESKQKVGKKISSGERTPKEPVTKPQRKRAEVETPAPANKEPLFNEPCKDCDWAALSAKDNDIQCHKKYCSSKKYGSDSHASTVDSSRPPVNCEICEMEFKSKDSLNIHFKFCKWVKDRKIIDNLPIPEQEGNSDATDENENEPAAECKQESEDRFKTKSVLVPNLVSETGESDSVVYKCEYCGRTSNNKGAVINHVRYCVHRPRQFVSPKKGSGPATGTTVIDLSHLSASMS